MASAIAADDYSFAAEYDGPPLPYSLPRAIPLDLSRIPLAALSSSDSSGPSDEPLPVVRPLTPSSLCSAIHAHQQQAAPGGPPPRSSSGPVADSPTSVIENHHAAAHHSAELPSSPSDAAPSDDEEDAGMPSVPHQPTASFAETSGSLLQSSPSSRSSSSSDEPPSSPLPHPTTTAAAARSSGALSPPHLDAPTTRSGCYRCGKRGGIWGGTEACLACGARYCSSCVLRAMGSMPEGRKCLPCIGRPVAEARRGALGRGSRVLRRLLSAAKVDLVMRSERGCKANQLLPEDVYVNGAKLVPEELAALQGCPCPPSRLRPGFYWYDKVSGFWGKVRQP